LQAHCTTLTTRTVSGVGGGSSGLQGGWEPTPRLLLLLEGGRCEGLLPHRRRRPLLLLLLLLGVLLHWCHQQLSAVETDGKPRQRLLLLLLLEHHLLLLLWVLTVATSITPKAQTIHRPCGTHTTTNSSSSGQW
jgi:hypothetical protein